MSNDSRENDPAGMPPTTQLRYWTAYHALSRNRTSAGCIYWTDLITVRLTRDSVLYCPRLNGSPCNVVLIWQVWIPTILLKGGALDLNPQCIK